MFVTISSCHQNFENESSKDGDEVERQISCILLAKMVSSKFRKVFFFILSSLYYINLTSIFFLP